MKMVGKAWLLALGLEVAFQAPHMILVLVPHRTIFLHLGVGIAMLE